MYYSVYCYFLTCLGVVGYTSGSVSMRRIPGNSAYNSAYILRIFSAYLIVFNVYLHAYVRSFYCIIICALITFCPLGNVRREGSAAPFASDIQLEAMITSPRG